MQLANTAERAPVPTTGPAHSSRLLELDGVRGIAVLMVLLGHLFSYSMMDRKWSGLPQLVLSVTGAGFLGVDLFFVLSGFLITGILIDTRVDPHYFRNFYARRALRILPLYLLILAILGVVYPGTGSFVLLSLAMSLNLAPIFGIPFLRAGSALWSLAVEEHFYLIWPWIARYIKPKALAIVSVAICILEPIIRAASVTPQRDVYFYSWFRFDGLAWGALIAIFVRWNGSDQRRALRFAGLLFIVAILAFAIGAPRGIMHRANLLGAALQFTIPQMVFTSLILALVTLTGSKTTALFRLRSLTIWGDLSYCLYVSHMVILEGVDAVYARFSNLDAAMSRFPFIAARAVVCMVVCFAVALMSRHLFELPIMRLGRYFRPTAK